MYLSYRERIAGLFLLFTLAGIVAFVVGAAIQNRWLEPRVKYSTLIVHADGLREGSDILLSGIKIGEVGQLTILSDNRVDVELLVLEQFAPRLRLGTTAEIRRLLGIGEKRILLHAGESVNPVLPRGALITANEPMDFLDMMATLDLGKYVATMDRTVSVIEVLLSKLEEGKRLERMTQAFDHIGPAMERMNVLLDEIHDPLVNTLNDPNIRKTFQGTSRVFNDPNTRMAMSAVSTSFAPDKLGALIERMETSFARFEELAAKDGDLAGTLEGSNRLLSDKRIERLLSSMEKLSDVDKLSKLIDNMAILSKEMAKMGPEIPVLFQELLVTMKEAVIVLRALQKHWLLDDEAREVREEMKRNPSNKP
jgi:hypothetical protein